MERIAWKKEAEDAMSEINMFDEQKRKLTKQMLNNKKK